MELEGMKWLEILLFIVLVSRAKIWFDLSTLINVFEKFQNHNWVICAKQALELIESICLSFYLVLTSASPKMTIWKGLNVKIFQRIEVLQT